MLRITETTSDEETITLLLEGRIIDQWIDEICNQCRANLSQQRKVILDFSGVRFVDERGIEALKELINDRIQLIGCSLFLSQLLNSAKENQ
ncbi:MAG: STAS domain-containing protein [Acidobacteriota bacterium]